MRYTLTTARKKLRPMKNAGRKNKAKSLFLKMYIILPVSDFCLGVEIA